MLTITIPAEELFDERTNKFVSSPEITLTLEHSLASLSKWEQKWEKPFLGKEARTTPETIDYVRCMNLSPVEPTEAQLNALTDENLKAIGAYINAKMTATWFNEQRNQPQPQTGETITAEVIYYWLIALTIPFEVQYWHLNRLLTLVRVVNIKNDPKKKMMPKADAAAQQRMLNEQRRVQLGTKG